ncbi:MAG TPA: imidazole glycerol phosphate synthase subunit HisH [Gemmatimonadaceae bacterium]|nr:imidazole glycerol phosphate synthase subunit HisH [Gemmatimonadaceae bacterium]
MKLSIFDYGAGNLHSLIKTLERPGIGVRIDTDPQNAITADALVLPGVGAFPAATRALGAAGRTAMQRAIRDGLPTLGICLGMQVLFDASDEGGDAGLGVIAGRVERLRAARVPQIGWNQLEIGPARDSLLDASELRTAYFANSFICRPVDASVVTAWSTHEQERFPAMVRVGRCTGVQFHPEKSSTAGVSFVHAWLREVQA